jgi:hypothetical protein
MRPSVPIRNIAVLTIIFLAKKPVDVSNEGIVTNSCACILVIVQVYHVRARVHCPKVHNLAHLHQRYNFDLDTKHGLKLGKQLKGTRCTVWDAHSCVQLLNSSFQSMVTFTIS